MARYDYHYERQVKQDLRNRLYMYLLSTTMSGIDRVRLIKRLDNIKIKVSLIY